jgi:hypothetical protein
MQYPIVPLSAFLILITLICTLFLQSAQLVLGSTLLLSFSFLRLYSRTSSPSTGHLPPARSQHQPLHLITVDDYDIGPGIHSLHWLRCGTAVYVGTLRLPWRWSRDRKVVDC